MRDASDRRGAERGRPQAAWRAHDRASALPAILAAVGESAVMYLPLHDIAVNEGRVVTGPMTHYWLFVLAMAGGVGAATVLRGSTKLLPGVAVSGVTLGLVQGTWWGTGDAIAIGTSVILWLLVATRAFTLALRDWRDPIGTSFGVGAAGLLAEITLMGGFADGRAVLPIAVPQFFMASVASRASSLHLATRREVAADRAGGTVRAAGARILPALLALAVLAGALGISFLLGGRHGGLLVLGRLTLAVVLPLVAYVLAPLVKLLFAGLIWLFALLHIDLSPLRSVAQTIDSFRAKPPSATSPGSGPVGRILALLVLLALGFLLVRTIRARWRRFERIGPSGGDLLEAIPAPVFSSQRRRRRSRVRQELPADTVRRWYAEALLSLERLGLPKAPSRTPSEYLRLVAMAFPESAPGFTALTRAYEDVRYGSLRLDRDTLYRLEANRQLAMAALGRANRLEQERGEETQ